jgi:hypothetical protein
MTELERFELVKQKGYNYNPETGELIGMFGKLIKRTIEGYVSFILYHGKKQYNIKVHRLGWYLHYGELPKNQIDHIDGNRSNNKIDNLRDVTNQQNQWNQTKAKGFIWNKQRKKFQSYIRIEGKLTHLGLFDKEQDARNAYLEAKAKYHIID